MAGPVGLEPTSDGFGDRYVTITPRTYRVEGIGAAPMPRESRSRVLLLYEPSLFYNIIIPNFLEKSKT